MIKLIIITKDGKITTQYQDEDIVLNDVALMIRELEKIKKELLELEFEKDFELKKEV